MQIHDLIQGSPEWHAYRANHRNASDAPAMMGLSPYKSRNQLLHECYTGLQGEVSASTQRLFDDGHRFEALARPLAEQIVGEPLYPITGSKGKLSASFDGLTLMEDVNYEHKTLNAEIRAAQSAADLGAHYRVQMEQQMEVSEAKKTLFLATRWSDNDELLEDRQFWYESDPALRAAVLAGWEQFEQDLAAYQPTVEAQKPVAETIMQLPALVVQTRGEVIQSNLPAFKAAAEQFIAKIKTDLATDEDFVNADANVKFCAEAEDKLELAKASVLGQAATIEEVMLTIDQIKGQLRTKRLALEKLITSKKTQIKETILSTAKLAFTKHIDELEAEIRPIRLNQPAPDFADAMKNKRTLASLNNAVDTLLAAAKISTNTIAADYRAKQAWCKANAEGYGFLFMDMQQIIVKPTEDFQLLVTTRIDAHKRKLELEKAAETARIRAEEQAKAEAAAAETLRLQREEDARAAAEVARAEQARVAAETKRQLEQKAADAAAQRASTPSPSPAVPASAAPEIARQASFYNEGAPRRAAAGPGKTIPSPRPVADLLDTILDVGPSDAEIIAFGAEHDMEVDELIPRLERFIADARAGALAVAA